MKVSEEILKLVAYVPGKPIEETQREFGLKKVVKLASNENPVGPSPQVLEAISQALPAIHRYPDASFYQLRKACSDYYQLDPSWISFGNGSNEIIDILIRLFCEPGEEILTSQRAFIAYRICAQAARIKTLEVPLTSSYQFDVPQTIQQLGTKAASALRLVFLANPNNPTGTYVGRAQIEDLCEAVARRPDTLLVIDEAYFEFVRAKDFVSGIELLKKYPQVVVIRSMSKVFGLAGLRLGALLARPEVVSLYDRVRNPFNVNSLAQVAAIAGLKDRDHLKTVQKITWQGLDYFSQELSRLGMTVVPSQGNFVLFDSRRDSTQLDQALLKKGVIMRPVKNYGWDTFLRLSVGLKDENEFAISALEKSLAEVPEV